MNQVEGRLHTFYENSKEGFEVAKEAITDLQEREKIHSISYGAGKMDWRGKNGGVKTIGIGISAEFIHKGFIDFRGREVRSPEQLALLGQVYRDPRFETLRVIYMKGNIIAGHEGITSRLPNSSAAIFDIPNREESASDKEYLIKSRHAHVRHFMGMLSRMERLGADGYFLLHNHPSAMSVEPSNEDLALTKAYKKALPGFRGHIIIDSNKFCFIDKDINPMQFPLYLGDDLLIKPSLSHPLLGSMIDSSDKLAQLGKAIQIDPNYSVIIYVNTKQYIRAIQEIPDGLLKREKECVDYLRGRMRDFGASRVLLVSSTESIHEIANDMVRKGFFLDAIVTDNSNRVNSVRESGVSSANDTHFSRWMGIYTHKSYRVNERGGSYHNKSLDRDAR